MTEHAEEVFDAEFANEIMNEFVSTIGRFARGGHCPLCHSDEIIDAMTFIAANILVLKGSVTSPARAREAGAAMGKNTRIALNAVLERGPTIKIYDTESRH